MLERLHIKNIAVIDEAEIEFNNGFNVLTGETGAGKSIIIDSINMPEQAAKVVKINTSAVNKLMIFFMFVPPFV